MAWIESHQDLATNPKTRRAARLLDVSVPQVIGHLHMLWWWTLDHAFDGDLSEYDALDIADAAAWEGDPDTFVKALVECGPKDKAGFLEEDLRVHDWGQFTAAMRAKREASAYANHVKWHENRGIIEPDCPHCIPEESADAPDGIPPESERSPDGDDAESTGTGTGTTPDQKTLLSPVGDDGPDPVAESFEEFWRAYPKRNGKKVGKANALIEWRKLSVDERRRAWIGARNLAASDQMPKDPERFLRRAKGGRGDFPFDDWQTPAAPRDGPSSQRVSEFETTRRIS